MKIILVYWQSCSAVAEGKVMADVFDRVDIEGQFEGSHK